MTTGRLLLRKPRSATRSIPGPAAANFPAFRTYRCAGPQLIVGSEQGNVRAGLPRG
jgi:hypothetical protein